MSWILREPARDAELGAALRQLETESSFDDGEPLRQRIVAAARPRLARLRSPAPRWWDWISRWMPVAVPVGLAASLVAGVLLPRSGDITSLEAYPADAGSDSTLVLAAFSEPTSGGQLAAHLVAPESGDWLFEQALTQ